VSRRNNRVFEQRRGRHDDRTLSSRANIELVNAREGAEEIAIIFRDGQARTETGEDHVLSLQYVLQGASLVGRLGSP
jgi:hypothetical protein